MNFPPGYTRGAEMTVELVRQAKAFGLSPLFAFPPGEICLTGSILDMRIGRGLSKLVRNEHARALVIQVIAEARARELEDVPTVLMLHVALEVNGIKSEVASLEELGIKLPKGRQ